ncbi:NADP-dependent oxidoreductase domain-containing protein [Sparassis latifolia]
MPWGSITLNDGTTAPSVAFGTWRRGNGPQTIDLVQLAIATGFTHIDTAQVYRNEEEAGVAIRASGLARSDLYITTKYSGKTDIDTAIRNSLRFLGVDYVDLYLIHGPDLAVPDIPTIWKKMEDIHEQGFAKSVGVSNFNISELKILLASAKIKPVANQILFHPYIFDRQGPLVEFGNQHGIVSEAYSPLIPLTHKTGGPVDAPVAAIAERLNTAPERILLAWARAKGTLVVTSSTKKERLEGYIAAGDLELTKEDVAAIDAAGLAGSSSRW